MDRCVRNGLLCAAVILAAMVAAAFAAEAQAASLVWTRTFNGASDGTEIGHGVAVDADGDICVAGYTGTPAQSNNLVVRTYSPSGGLRWARTFNGAANGNDVGYAVAAAANQDLYVVGHTEVAGQDLNLLLRKYSPSGTSLWQRTYNRADNLAEQGLAVAVAPNGAVYVAGVTRSSVQGDDLLLVKYSASGARLWVRTYNGPGNGSEEANGVAVAPDGNVYVVGRIQTALPNDLLLRKYSPSGALLWSRTYDGPFHGSDAGTAVAVDGNDAVYVTGYSETSAQSENIVLRKYSSSGAVVWTRFYDNPQNGWDFGNGIAVADDGSVNVTGASGTSKAGNLLLLRYSSGGALLGKRVYAGAAGSDDVGIGVAVGSGSRVYVTGGTQVEGQGYDLLLLKYQ